MNIREIAFIISCNHEQELAECLYYIERLHVPEGFQIDVIAVREAASMAEAYNGGMNSSGAKYKVYLHQDVFIINRNFIRDMLAVFEENQQIGIIGCMGTRRMPDNALAVGAWDTGKLLQNLTQERIEGYLPQNREYVQADAVDGLLMVTQYDIFWREDLFDGWDFYDISQCYEFRRAGKLVVVPQQREFWCYHDNKYSKMKEYDKYRELFIREYQDCYPFQKEEKEFKNTDEYEQLQIEAARMFEALLSAGQIEEMSRMFASLDNKGHACLREYETVAAIYNMEMAQKESRNLFWIQGQGSDKTMEKFRHLKHLVKRIEFDAEGADTMERLIAKYSIYAISVMVLIYGGNQAKIMEKTAAYLKEQKQWQKYGFISTVVKDVIGRRKL